MCYCCCFVCSQDFSLAAGMFDVAVAGVGIDAVEAEGEWPATATRFADQAMVLVVAEDDASYRFEGDDGSLRQEGILLHRFHCWLTMLISNLHRTCQKSAFRLMV